MISDLDRERAAQISVWAAHLAASDLAGATGTIDFHATDRDGDWWHRCRVEAGELVDWRTTAPAGLAIHHGSADLVDLYSRRSPFDAAWRSTTNGTGLRPLPPWDCGGEFGSRSLVLPGIVGELTWHSVCTTPRGAAVGWITSFGSETVHNEVLTADPGSFAGPSFEFPIATYLGLRTGQDPLALFDTGGSLAGDLDELIFIAGVVADPTWMSCWSLAPDAASMLSTFFLTYPHQAAPP